MKTFLEITALLQSVGNITETARLKMASLTEDERDFILTARQEAKKYGLSQIMTAVLEDEGARVVRENLYVR